ncbi:type II toxin-antitoxin system PemK/MazF family toxin [Pandoraea commovens]|uniref:type II toxin-antitoxin system PemK/MazF family toxin n=2 Tax=Pandoraea commovens TaxID=2508289 RepID=UPI0012411DC8
MLKRGEIWIARFDPAIGCEMGKTRPCVILSPSPMNKHTQTVIVAPLTSSDASRFSVSTTYGGRQGAMQLSHLRSMDRQRLVRHSGALDRHALRRAMARLRSVFSEEVGEAGD